MYSDAVRLLQALVRIDSRNMKRLSDSAERDADEEGMCAFLKAHLQGLGLEVAVQHAAPRRPQLVAYLHRDDACPTLAFEAHMDTVGTDGMTGTPFAAEIRDGRLYGRGACDTKGSMAGMLVALERLQAAELSLNLMFIATCAEETGCEGSPLLDLSRWQIDGIIVGEPTSNRPVTAHKAHAEFELVCRGKSAHGARPEMGRNAVYDMIDVVNVIRTQFAPELAAHSALGFSGSTISVTMINGGSKVNVIPDRCSACADLRLVPGHGEPDEIIGRIVAEARVQTQADVHLGWTQTTPALQVPSDSPLVRALCRAIERSGDSPEIGTVNYCTDAGVFAAKGYQSVICGPGSIAQAHSAEEYIELAELARFVEILVAAGHEFAAVA